MTVVLDSVERAIADIKSGKAVVVVDDEDRENEGDLTIAAEKVTPEIINFMLNGRGQLCVSLLPDTCQRLNLHPIVADNTAPLRTNDLTHRTSASNTPVSTMFPCFI